MNQAPLLIEIGVEEIPAGVAPRMAEALQQAVTHVLSEHNIESSSIRLGVTPRRLLLHIEHCPLMQSDREEILWGPPEKVAYHDGEPTRAALGFAKKSGLALDAFTLCDKGDGKARYMKATQHVKGKAVIDILAAVIPDILRKLPSPKSMRWQDGKHRNDGFIRPVRWIVALLGDQVIPFHFAGIASNRQSRGHRMHPNTCGKISVTEPFAWLEERWVVADRNKRKQSIAEGLRSAAEEAGVSLVNDAALLDEVTDLTEWPHVITGHYQQDFLRLPIEVSRIELKHHQRCFASHDGSGKTSHVFFAVANICSKQPQAVAEGNERVVNARLADAAFYYDRDPKESLEARVEALSNIVFQDGLGMVGDQVRRLRGFVLDNAEALGVDTQQGQRAAYLCKSDLTTGLVGEFPELQGYMGGIYARMNGESEAIAQAISEHYMPAGADDALPESREACAIGIAERADKLLGYFHLGRIPSASADPFALRRAAIGLIRLLAHQPYDIRMTLKQILHESAKQWNQQRVTIAIQASTEQAVLEFIHERLLGMADDWQLSRASLEAALAASVARPIHEHMAVAHLLNAFSSSEHGQAVAAANKRIANILKKSGQVSTEIQPNVFIEDAEHNLFKALEHAKANFPSSASEQLKVLAGLRQNVDAFFDDVMVMADDEAIRCNRLALLKELRSLFLRLADISKL